MEETEDNRKEDPYESFPMASNDQTRCMRVAVVIGAITMVLIVLCSFILATVSLAKTRGMQGSSATIEIHTNVTKIGKELNMTELEIDITIIKSALAAFHPSFWYRPIPSNGYEYQVTSTRMKWRQSRVACRKLGGDLAVYGMKDRVVQRKIINGLLKPASVGYAWYGISDLVQEGVWKWIDGLVAGNETVHWWPGEPNNAGGSQNCGAISAKITGYFTDDGRCSSKNKALCERTFNASRS